MKSKEEEYLQGYERIQSKIFDCIDGENIFQCVSVLYDCLNFVLIASENISDKQKKEFIDIVCTELPHCLEEWKKEIKKRKRND